MSKTNKELAVDLYCAKLIADALVYPHLKEKPARAVPDVRDEAEIIRQISEALTKSFDD